MPSTATRRRQKSNPLHFRATPKPSWPEREAKIGFECRMARELRARTANRATVARRSNSFCRRNGSRRGPVAGSTPALAQPATAPTSARSRTKWRTSVVLSKPRSSRGNEAPFQFRFWSEPPHVCYNSEIGSIVSRFYFGARRRSPNHFLAAAASWIFFTYLAGSLSKSFLQPEQHNLTSWPW